MNPTLHRRALCLCALLLSSALSAVPAALPAQTKPPAASQSPADKAATDELKRLFNEGNKAYEESDFPTALKAYKTGLDKAQAFNNQKYTAQFLNNIGAVHYALIQYDKALDFYQQALTLREKMGNQQYLAGSLNNIGNVYWSLGQYDKALDFYQRALTLREKMDSPLNIATSLVSIGNVYDNLGQYDKALDYQQQALTLQEMTGNQPYIAGSLNNIGSIYYALGQYDKALDYHQRALALYEKTGNPQYIALSLHNTGLVYDSLGQFDKALDFYQKALLLYEKTGNSQYIAEGLNSIGLVYFHLGQHDKALEYHQRALLKEKTGNPLAIAESLNIIGSIYYTLGQNDNALDSYQKALALCAGIGNQQGSAKSLNGIGEVYAAQKQWDKAEIAYSRARRLFENLSQQVGDPTQLADLQKTMGHFYERYANVLAQQKREGEGLALLEAGRAQGLARQIALNGSDYTAYFTTDEKKQLKQRTVDLTTSSNLLHATEAKLVSSPAEQRAALQKQKDDCQKRQAEAEQKYTAYRDFLFARYPQFREVSGERPPTVAELKSLARKNPDTLFLTWAILDDKATTLYALTAKDSLKTYTLPVGEKGLVAMVSEWRQTLSAGNRGVEAVNTPKEGKDEEAQAKALYQTLFAPLEKDGLMKPGRYTHIVTVATGPLLDIPLTALLDTNGKRLIETHTIAAAIALGITFWRDNPAAPTSEMLCIADPIGKAAAPAVTQIALRREGWSELPGAREEGTQVGALFKNESLLIGPAAKKADVLKAMPGAQLLHFATHGYLNDKNPLLSGLVLAPEPEGSGDDGVLSAREILNTPLAARIAVLSACETGRGKVAGGEGLQGLAWAFRAAGCPCVVASQWQVDDAATRDLMVAFYRNLLAHQRKDDALRNAMLLIKAQAGKASPFYWAAFQVIGDTSAL